MTPATCSVPAHQPDTSSRFPGARALWVWQGQRGVPRTQPGSGSHSRLLELLERGSTRSFSLAGSLGQIPSDLWASVFYHEMQKTIPSSRRLKGAWPRAGIQEVLRTPCSFPLTPHLPKPSAIYWGQTMLGGHLKSRSYSGHWLLSPQRGAHHSSERNRGVLLTLSPPLVFPSRPPLQGREGPRNAR